MTATIQITTEMLPAWISWACPKCGGVVSAAANDPIGLTRGVLEHSYTHAADTLMYEVFQLADDPDADADS